MSSPPTLLAVPNISEGRDPEVIAAVAAPAGPDLLAVHSDPDHNRTVLTIAGRPGELAARVLACAREALARIDLSRHEGIHPRVGAIDVAPIVHLSDADMGAACAEALVLANLLADELALPVFLYGALAQGRTRAELRRGGPSALSARIAAGEVLPDFGPHGLHPTAGAALVAARPPLVAFNVELAPPATVEDARRIAAEIREGGQDGMPSLRAIGLWLEHRGVAQVSMNLEDHHATPLAAVVAAIRDRAAVTEAELVGLAPAGAFAGFPADVPVRNRMTIEDGLTRAGVQPPADLARGDKARG